MFYFTNIIKILTLTTAHVSTIMNVSLYGIITYLAVLLACLSDPAILRSVLQLNYEMILV